MREGNNIEHKKEIRKEVDKLKSKIGVLEHEINLFGYSEERYTQLNNLRATLQGKQERINILNRKVTYQSDVGLNGII